MYLYIHSCGEPAFRLTVKPNKSDVIYVSTIRHLDHTPIESGDPAICDSCNQNLESLDFNRVVLATDINFPV